MVKYPGAVGEKTAGTTPVGEALEWVRGAEVKESLGSKEGLVHTACSTHFPGQIREIQGKCRNFVNILVHP